MVEAITYDGYIEHFANGSFRAFLTDLLGCAARGDSAGAALDTVTAAIPAYYEWLRTHDEYTPEVHGPFRAQAVATQNVPSGHRAGFFPSDAVPMSKEDLDWNVAILDWSYEDLTRASGAAAHANHIESLVQQQLWLISRIEPQPNVPSVAQLPGGPTDHLRQIWRASVARLSGASDEDRERVLEHEGERWSLRKVLRCSILSVREALATLGV